MSNGAPAKVSVVVVTFNQKDTIAQTLDSILMQQCDFPFEIQIGDDCSTDGTSDICSRYAALHPDIIHHHRNKTNEGVRDNYFDALLRCAGTYIADCAGDDYWTDPLKLQKEADILDSDPGISLVHTGWEYLDTFTNAVFPPDTSRLRKEFRQPLSAPGELFLPLLRNRGTMAIHLCTALYRKDIFMREISRDDSLFRNPEYTCEDMIINLVYAHEGAIAYLPDVTLRYRTGHDSLSSRHNYLKAFDFYFGSLRLSADIADRYGVGQEQILPTHISDGSFLFAQAFLAHDRQRLNRLTAFLSSRNIPLSWKNRLLLLSTRNRILWNTAAAIKLGIARIRHKK